MPDGRCRGKRSHRARPCPGVLPFPLGGRACGDFGALPAAPRCRARTRPASVPAAHPPSMPAPDPRKWVRAMRAIESGIADGQWKPGDQLPARSALAQRYGLNADAVMRAQDELLRSGVLRKGQVYGALYVSDAEDQQAPGAPLPAAPGLEDRGGYGAVSPPAKAGGGGAGTRRLWPATREHTHARTPGCPRMTGWSPARRRPGVPPLRMSCPPERAAAVHAREGMRGPGPGVTADNLRYGRWSRNQANSRALQPASILSAARF